MVFTNLHSHEKEAFFSLLDEYFASRPEVFAQLGTAGNGSTPSQQQLVNAATSVVGRTVASNSAPKFVSAANKHLKSNAYNSKPPLHTTYDSHLSNSEHEPESESQSVAGRVAAAASLFSNSNVAPAIGRRASTVSNTDRSNPGLTTQQKIGNVDTSSAKNALFSTFSGKKNSAVPAAPPPPPAFAKTPNNFSPPPRREPSGPPAIPTRRQPTPEPEPEPEPQGEWVEAIFDYSSNDPADIPLEEGQHIFVTERTSEDWWTGEVNGKSGLFPVSYVKAL